MSGLPLLLETPMGDTPNYVAWPQDALAPEATRLYKLLVEKQHEIECLKLDIKTRREAYRKFIVETSK